MGCFILGYHLGVYPSTSEIPDLGDFVGSRVAIAFEHRTTHFHDSKLVSVHVYSTKSYVYAIRYLLVRMYRHRYYTV